MHTQADVCSRWKSAHVLTTPDVLMASGADCDPGYLAPGAIVDVLSRLNMFRWLNGLGPTSDDPQLDAAAQKCADLEAFWPFMGGDPHSPPSTSKCWSSDGATAAQTSNVAWGSGNPAQSIDQWMQDTDNDSNLGHRRWIVNPPLGPVGIGYWKTGGVYGDAACMQVFGTSNTGPNPSWTAVPNAGFVPIEITAWTWSFHGSLGGIATATVSVLRVDDSTNLPVTVTPLDMGYGQEAVGFKPQGWTAEAGKTYRVTVTGPPSGPVTYDVKPVTCN